jgi:hypothetical protein
MGNRTEKFGDGSRWWPKSYRRVPATNNRSRSGPFPSAVERRPVVAGRQLRSGLLDLPLEHRRRLLWGKRMPWCHG